MIVLLVQTLQCAMTMALRECVVLIFVALGGVVVESVNVLTLSNRGQYHAM